MIRHIVLQRFREDLGGKKEKAELLGRRFAALTGRIPGLSGVEFGENLCAGEEYDLALCCLFDTAEQLRAYQDHPLHQEIKELSGPWLSKRTVMDICLPPREAGSEGESR